jgi:pimeloyl-ACP methyl ester carboxylesterase
MEETDMSSKRSIIDDLKTRRSMLRLGVIGASAALMPKVALSAAAPSSGAVFRYSVGITAAPSTYYEVIEPPEGSDKPPLVLIPGGNHSGSCYLSTPDGRTGWAQAFAARGYKVVMPDWAGTGRSGYIPQDKLTGDMVVEGLGKVISSFGRRVVVLTHSMSGAYGWPLIERYGQYIEKMVAVAPGEPGNTQLPAKILSQSGDVMEVQRAFASTKFTLNLKEPYAGAMTDIVEKKFIGNSKRFPVDHVQPYKSSLIALPSRLLYERLNVDGSQLKVSNFANFKGKRIVILVGTDDVDHAGDSDKRIADWLNQNGANAEFATLGKYGIFGNGHMMMIENNSDQIAGVIADWIEKS